ncbi:MAG: cupin domain-containing protein [Bacteroidales bacterium]|nr:cupin domain-containing protein [Bacteroidales bacterium]
MANNTFEKSKKYTLKESVSNAEGSVVSKIIQKNEAGNITLFAFAEGQNLSEHTAPFDALVQIIEGSAKIIIDGKSHLLTEGEMIIMPAGIPHAVEAETAFKMLLTMLKK